MCRTSRGWDGTAVGNDDVRISIAPLHGTAVMLFNDVCILGQLTFDYGNYNKYLSLVRLVR